MAITFKHKETDINPFFYRGIEIPEQYFCDREKETETLLQLIQNGNNIVLKAPRRLGKSSLIHHLFNQKKIKDNYNCIYADIYSTRTSEDFVGHLYRSIAECRTISGKKSLTDMEKQLKEISYDIEFNIPKILKISKSNKYEIQKFDKSLDVLFKFLSETKHSNLIVIDEFQQIKNYTDCDIESSLRAFIQKAPNTCFIFSGSSKHLLSQIFDFPTKPFYRSSRSFTLDVISKDTYIEFCARHFEANGRNIETNATELVYDVFCGNTFMMQQTMNGIYQYTSKGETATVQSAKDMMESLVDEKAEDYRTYLHSLKSSYEQVLLYIANKSIAGNLTSEKERKLYDLPASSSVENILTYFQNDDSRMIERLAPKIYKLEDKFFELWAAKYVFGNLESKFANAGEIFEKEKEYRKIILTPARQRRIQ